MSLLDHAPHFTVEEVVQFALERYNLRATVSALPSERDQNFLLKTDAGACFVLKLANATESHAMLEAQNLAMAHVAKSIDLCPRVIAAVPGNEIETVTDSNGVEHWMRLVTYLPGLPMGSIKRHSDEMLYSLGQSVAQLDAALTDFDHPVLHRDFHWDFANGLKIVREYEALVVDVEMRAAVQKIAADFEANVIPLMPGLRKSVIYNDANDYNVLVSGGEDLYMRNQHVAGLIDFGDMLYSYTVGDLAIACAYAILDKPNPLAAAAQILRGYHAAFPLNEAEIAVLFSLITMRLAMSVCIGADQQRRQPDNAYLGISQQPIRNTLPRLLAIHPRLAVSTFRAACGLPASKSAPAVVDWLKEHAKTFAPILPEALHKGEPVVFDLSIGSPLLKGDAHENEEPALTPRLAMVMTQAGAAYGVGRYNEARYIYTASTFATGSGLTDETRTVHLGIDLFAAPGTPIYAPLEGTVHAFADNAAPQDYGPVIGLKHQVRDDLAFYTLYGHLSRASLTKLTKGQTIKKGEAFAEIGSADINGRWTPHLHFQIVTDNFELGGDFPGVARPSQREVWLSLCPDPNLILNIPEKYFPAPEPVKAETLATRRQRLGGNLSIAYREPVKVVRGWRQYLFDDEGRRYLDTYNNVAHVGHCHPRVVEAARQQIGVLNTNTRYLHDFINRYAERLSAKLPQPLSVCYFVNSASEANELALRLARAYTNQRDMIVLEAAYHGHTTGLIDISPYKHAGPGGKGAPDWVHAAPIPDVYRGAYKADDSQAGEQYAAPVADLIAALQARGRGLAGYIAESLPSVGGQIVFPPNYLATVYQHVRAANGVCIADEVQTGFGRVGSHFWGFEMQGVTPDIVVLGKPIGNGHPIGAVVTTPEIAAVFDNGMEFFSTYGGNPVSCAVGLAVLDVIEEERLQVHAQKVGTRLLEKLKPLATRYPVVGDVRGSGLFLGLEMVRDRATLEPAAAEASFVVNRLRERGILLGTDGPYHNVVKIRPPMPFDDSDADFLVETLEKILSADFEATLMA